MSIKNGLTSVLAVGLCAFSLTLSLPKAALAEQASSAGGYQKDSPEVQAGQSSRLQQLAQMPMATPNVNMAPNGNMAQNANVAPGVNVAPTLPSGVYNPAPINDTNPGRPYNPNSALPPESAIGTGGITVTTTPQIDGYHVRRYLGIVRGVRVFQPTIGESFKASFKGIIGGNIGSYVEMCEKAREQAYDLMLERCTTLGANAVLGFRYDNAAFSLNSSEMGTEVICYGTAVFVEPNR